MDSARGLFITLEGVDQSSKNRQAKLLIDTLQQAGHQTVFFDFPQLGQASSFFVRQYLDGAYGNSQAVGPYTASLFYALDHYHAAKKIQQALADGKIVIATQFTGDNLARQGTKFVHAEERRGYFIWADNLEYEMLGIPRPDKNLVLRVPAALSRKLIFEP